MSYNILFIGQQHYKNYNFLKLTSFVNMNRYTSMESKTLKQIKLEF